MKKIRAIKLIVVTFLITLILVLSSSKVIGRDNYAFSAGTVSDDINTKQDILDSSNAYSNAGYRVGAILDPSKQQLWENLYADVQFFSTHGNVQWINFVNSGIAVGDTNDFYIGTNAVHWDADTILVTYSSCNSAGANGNNDTNSIACKTAERGADVVVGFRKEIDVGSSRNWANRYNTRLSQGYGVLDSANYANSFIYLFPSVKENQIWHHGDANMKIGKYRNNLLLEDERNILKDSKMVKMGTREGDIDNIINHIKNYYPKFDISNYEIVQNHKLISSDVNSKKSDEINYIDFQLKVGDFYTNAGFTAVLKNGTIDAIYDNNINIEKQEKALEEREKFIVNLDNVMQSKMKIKAINEVKNKYDGVKIGENIQKKYYFNLENNKKYVVFSIPSIMKTEKGDSIAYDTVQFEIKGVE